MTNCEEGSLAIGSPAGRGTSVPVKNWPENHPVLAGSDAGATDSSHYAYWILSGLLRTAI